MTYAGLDCLERRSDYDFPVGSQPAPGKKQPCHSVAFWIEAGKIKILGLYLISLM